MPMMEKVLAVAAIVVILLVLVLVQIAPAWPKTLVGWGVILLVGLPLYVVLEIAWEVLFERMWGGRVGSWVTRRTEYQRFSWLRVCYALVIGMLVVGVFVVVIVLLNQSEIVREFLAKHFEQ